MDLDYYFSERRGTRTLIAYVLLAIGLLLLISAILIGAMRASDSPVAVASQVIAAISLPVIDPQLAASFNSFSPDQLKKLGALGLLVVLPLLILLIIGLLVVMRIAWRMSKDRHRAKPTTYVDAWARHRMPPEKEVMSNE